MSRWTNPREGRDDFPEPRLGRGVREEERRALTRLAAAATLLLSEPEPGALSEPEQLAALLSGPEPETLELLALQKMREREETRELKKAKTLVSVPEPDRWTPQPRLSEAERAEALRTVEAFIHVLELTEPEPEPDLYRDAYWEWVEDPYWVWVDRYDNPPPGVLYRWARPPHPENPPPRWHLVLRRPPVKKRDSWAVTLWRKIHAVPQTTFKKPVVPRPSPKAKPVLKAKPKAKAKHTTQLKPKPRPLAADANDQRLHPRVGFVSPEEHLPAGQPSWAEVERSFQNQRNEAAHRYTLQLVDQLFPYTPPEEIIWRTTT